LRLLYYIIQIEVFLELILLKNIQ